jgi:hypothetical protein
MKNATIKFLLPNAFPISKTGFYNTLPSVGIGCGESENGVLNSPPMTTSRGAAAPHRLPAASGRDRHVRDSPVILGCARSLAGIVSPVSLWHLASSAS